LKVTGMRVATRFVRANEPARGINGFLVLHNLSSGYDKPRRIAFFFSSFFGIPRCPRVLGASVQSLRLATPFLLSDAITSLEFPVVCQRRRFQRRRLE